MPASRVPCHVPGLPRYQPTIYEIQIKLYTSRHPIADVHGFTCIYTTSAAGSQSHVALAAISRGPMSADSS